jgi:WD40 repeat protein
LAVAQRGEICMSGSSERGSVRLLDPDSLEQVGKLGPFAGNVTCMAFSGTGEELVLATDEFELQIWSLSTERRRKRLDGGSFRMSVRSIACSPDGTRFVTGAVENEGMDFHDALNLWSLKTGACLGSETVAGRQIAFAPDGSCVHLVDGPAVAVFDLKHSVERRTQVLDTYPMALACSPLTGGVAYESGGQVWLIEKGRSKKLVRSPVDVWCLAFSPTGHTLAGGCKDGVVRIWELGTGKVRTELRGHEEPVSELAFAPDARFLVSCSEDGASKWSISA